MPKVQNQFYNLKKQWNQHSNLEFLTFFVSNAVWRKKIYISWDPFPWKTCCEHPVKISHIEVTTAAFNKLSSPLFFCFLSFFFCLNSVFSPKTLFFKALGKIFTQIVFFYGFFFTNLVLKTPKIVFYLLFLFFFWKNWPKK